LLVGCGSRLQRSYRGPAGFAIGEASDVELGVILDVGDSLEASVAFKFLSCRRSVDFLLGLRS
jgi:hypothetical protein